MQLKAMLTDEDAVSPVIGVILMVAITVILAAVIASFVLGLGPGDQAPQAQFDLEGGDGEFTLTHNTGDKIEPGPMEISYDGEESGTVDGTRMHSSLISAGDSVIVDGGSSLTSGTYTVTITYDMGDTSSTIYENEVTVN